MNSDSIIHVTSLQGDTISFAVKLLPEKIENDTILKKVLQPLPILAVLISIAFGFLQFWIRRKSVFDARILKATEYFTGGTQKRSVGISIIEGVVETKSYRDVLIPLLYHQFYYLLIAANPKDKTDKSTAQKSRPHEVKNLERIIKLLVELVVNMKKPSKIWSAKILRTLEERKKNNNSSKIGDERSYLDVSESTLVTWISRFDIPT